MSIVLLSKKQYEMIDETFNWLGKTNSISANAFRIESNAQLVGKDTYTYYTTESFAEGDGILPRGSREISTVNAKQTSVSTKLLTLGRAFVIHREDLWTNTNIEATGVEIARNQLDLDVDNVAFKSLLALPNKQVFVATNGAGASPLWKNKTSNEILTDIRKMKLLAEDEGRNRPTELFVAPALIGVLQTKTVGQDNLKTLYEYLTNDMKINITEVRNFKKASSTDTDVVAMFDKSKLSLILPMAPMRNTDVQSFDEAGNYQSSFFAICGGIKCVDTKALVVSENVGE